MKKILAFILFAIFLFTNSNTTVLAEQKKPLILSGGVQMNVPKTPDEVTAYLIKMKAIMQEYDQLGSQLMLVVMSGSPSPQAANNARNEWIRLANKIDAIAPPTEVTASHKQLAASLRRSSSFLVSIANVGPDQKQQVLTSMVPVVSDLMTSATSYNQGITSVINRMGLDPSLNPLGANGSMNSSLPNMGGMGGLGGLQNLQNLGF